MLNNKWVCEGMERPSPNVVRLKTVLDVAKVQVTHDPGKQQQAFITTR